MVGNYITSFICFLPADNPKVVLYVAIDNPKGITAYGGTVAAPIARNILEDIIPTLDIKPSSEGVDKEYQYYETKYESVANVVGMSPKEAQKALSNFTVKYSGTGDKVISMSPEAGSKVPVGSTIRLMLESSD